VNLTGSPRRQAREALGKRFVVNRCPSIPTFVLTNKMFTSGPKLLYGTRSCAAQLFSGNLTEDAKASAGAFGRRECAPGRQGGVRHSRDTPDSSGMKVDGSWFCDNLTFEADVDPASVLLCHSAMEGSLRLLSGTPTIYVKVAESGNGRNLAFCPTCGIVITQRLRMASRDTSGFVRAPLDGVWNLSLAHNTGDGRLFYGLTMLKS